MAIEDFEVGLGRRTANFAPLTPLVFLDWSADVYPEHVAVVHGARRYSWSATRDRCRRLASARRRISTSNDSASSAPMRA